MIKRAATVAMTAVLGLTASTGVHAEMAHARVHPGVGLLAQHGFGDWRNSLAWSMAWFEGKLYVGTGRLVNCVENATVDYYLVVSQRYKTRPISGVRCPRNRYDMNLRAEIWQYTPRTDRWRRVYRSPVGRNPRARRKVIARDIAFRGMTVYRDRRGRKRLYVGDVTANEYVPELRRRHPPRILSTSDGRHFRAAPATHLIGHTPSGYQRPMGFRSMKVWRGRLYVTASATLAGQGAVYEVIRPWSRRARFKQITPPDLAVFETEVFAGHLYAGTGDRTNGYGVYRISAKRRHGERGRYAPLRYRVKPVVTGGAGRGATATSVVSMHVFRDRLYVGSSGWYNNQGIPRSEMIRVNRRGDWQVVAGAPRKVDGVTKGPISGLGDGFFNIFSAHFWRMEDYDGALYVTTNDWSYLVRVAFPELEPWIAGTLQSALAGEYGFDVWATCDGRDWFPVTRDAFGQSNMLDFGGRSIVASPAGLFIGSANHAQGTKVWRSRAGACSSLVAAAAPQRLLTDAQRGGNVVSWRPAAGASGYRILRAAYVTVPLTLAAPPVLPSGFHVEDQLPEVVPRGTPGAKEVQLPVLTPFTPVGTASRTVYVDRAAEPGQRYAYRVQAFDASGRRSVPSAMQIAPDPRPAPTFDQLSRELPTATARGLASRARADGRESRLQALARLQRSVDPDTDAGELIERLQRRIRYARLAGGH